MPKRFSRGWLLACVLGCINALPTRRVDVPATDIGFSSNIGDLMAAAAAAATEFDFEDFSPEKYAEKVEEASIELLDLDEGASSTTTTSPSVRTSNYVLLPRLLEPDAEMLPAHYTGVQPPGVDHMEITMMDSASLSSNRKNSLSDGPNSADFKSAAGSTAATFGGASAGSNGEKGFLSKVSFEKSLKGEKSKENQKAQYADAAGKKKSSDQAQAHFKGHKDESAGEKSETYEIDGHREKGHNAAGFHNVYHKDEFKKDADFYDNDHQAGRIHKHGRYNEKHVATEGDFRKGASHKSAFVEADAGKKGQFEKARNNNEANGRDAKSGYHGFFDNINEFAKNVGGAAAKTFAKAEGTAAKV